MKDAYITQLIICQEKGIPCESGGHYQTKIDFGGKEFYVSPDGSDVVRYEFNITGCLKTRKIKDKNGKVRVIHFHKDRLPVYGTITRQKRFRQFIYKYLLFLRCDGIENVELLRLYLLHCIAYHFEFWRKGITQKNGLNGQVITEYLDWVRYEPDYEDIEKMIDGLLTSALKKEIDEQTREQFVVRTRCVVRRQTIDQYGGVRKKSRGEKVRDERKGIRMATDNRIWTLYDPELKDQENADKIGMSISRFKEWKADNRDRLESKEDKVRRLYDPALSPGKNASVIGCSVNTVKKYLNKWEQENAVEEIDDPDMAWVKSVLEEQSPVWEDAPMTKKKRDEEMDEMKELLADVSEYEYRLSKSTL